MYDAACVDNVQRLGEVYGHSGNGIRPQRPVLEPSPEGRSVHVLHDQVRVLGCDRVRHARIEQCDQSVVIERCEGTNLADLSPQISRLANADLEEFEGDRASEHLVVRSVNGRHAAAAYQALYQVAVVKQCAHDRVAGSIWFRLR